MILYYDEILYFDGISKNQITQFSLRKFGFIKFDLAKFIFSCVHRKNQMFHKVFFRARLLTDKGYKTNFKFGP